MANTLAEFRTERDVALQATDCIYSPDLIKNYGEDAIATLDVYRQQLRDATDGVTDDKKNQVNNNGKNDDNDPLYLEAVQLIISKKKASTSLIQRHFQIGYNRAARIIEKMEENNVVSEADRIGRREVLINKQ